MIVQNYHYFCVRQSGNNRVHYAERALALELRVRLNRVVRDRGIFLECFVGPRQTHRVHSDGANLLDNHLKQRHVQPAGYKFLLIETVPVHGGEAHATSGCVDYVVPAGV